MTLKIATKLLTVILWIVGIIVLLSGLPIEYCGLMWAFPAGRAAGAEMNNLFREMFEIE